MRKALIGLSILVIVIGIVELFRARLSEDTQPFALRPSSPEDKEPSPQLAIVLDDWGYSRKNLPLLFSIKAPLTIAVLPLTPYATETAERAKREGMEVILHLPLEPHRSNINLEEETIMCGMGREEIARILALALARVPGAQGVSSHMGSKATEDRVLVTFLLEEIRLRDLFFLDSITTPRSACKDVAREVGVRFIKRDGLFLDIQYKEREDIHQRLIGLAKIALRSKEAVGIGHAKQETLEVIQKTLPELEAMGVRLVYLSKIVNPAPRLKTRGFLEKYSFNAPFRPRLEKRGFIGCGVDK